MANLQVVLNTSINARFGPGPSRHRRSTFSNTQASGPEAEPDALRARQSAKQIPLHRLSEGTAIRQCHQPVDLGDALE
jgi:hypothetical protein